MAIASLLDNFKHLFTPDNGVVLDLACGQGKNGLALKTQDIDVLFSDINSQHLTSLSEFYDIKSNFLWHADFESDSQTDAMKLSAMQLQGCIVFRYLHRPLFDSIINAVKPGGFVIYETFTEDNRQFGRPNRAQFLLKKNELKTLFKDWRLYFYFEGIVHNPDRAIAQIVCQKPY